MPDSLITVAMIVRSIILLAVLLPAVSAAHAADRIVGATQYDYGAVCDGKTDDTGTLKKWMASGGTLFLMPGVCIVSDTLEMNTPNQRLAGMGGELRFVAGIRHGYGIHVKADGVWVDGARLSNPNELGTGAGGRNVGILVAAHYSRVTNNTIDRFQNGIQVSSRGEYQNHIISGNFIRDVTGAGTGGPDGDIGEDRGDGITVWGAQATITGNVINCKAGHDCRIGIHAEGLGDQQRASPPRSNEMFTATGNIVTGPFRRMIVFEDVTHGAINGNSTAGGNWWGIASIRSSNIAITGNSVLFDRDPDNKAGWGYNPEYAGIMLYGRNRGVTVAGNAIKMTGAALAGINLQGLPLHSGRDDRNSDVTITGNTITATKATRHGIRAVYSDRVTIADNAVHGVADKDILRFGAGIEGAPGGR
ncbi:MAG: hypothetical protein GC131_05685 [Alphaproteobacteria bacterium]|nr:hypothetical protein [Alphaproteobacteria bacterium]